MKQKKLIVVCGPTASGKTKLGIELAKVYNGEIVSADSMQVYQYMDIGTAKPSTAEMQGIPHHMLSICSPEQPFSVALYVKKASECVDIILQRGKQPIIVGGTGLYIDSLCRGLEFADESPDRSVIADLQAEAKDKGLCVLYARLQDIDPDSAARMSPQDEKRILRALEVFLTTGKTQSEHNRLSKLRPPRYARATIGLSFQDREDLRQRINQRVDEMVAQGLFQELDALLARGTPATALQAIGYKEILQARAQGLPDSWAIEEIKLRSRQYAKRQLTWFRRTPDVHWILWDKHPDFSAALQNSRGFLASQGLE